MTDTAARLAIDAVAVKTSIAIKQVVATVTELADQTVRCTDSQAQLIAALLWVLIKKNIITLDEFKATRAEIVADPESFGLPKR